MPSTAKVDAAPAGTMNIDVVEVVNLMRSFEGDEYRAATSPRDVTRSLSIVSEDFSSFYTHPKLYFCEDILMKNHFLVSNRSACSLFFKYLYYGSWIFPLMEEANSRGSLASMLNLPESSCDDQGNRQSLPNFGTKFRSLMSDNKSFEIIRNILGDTTTVYFAFALALQQFSRSELFSTASEANWCKEVVRKMPLPNYLKQRDVSHVLKCNEACRHSTQGLLDELFFHLHRATSYGRDAEAFYFRNSQWVFALDDALFKLPFAVQVESAHPMRCSSWTVSTRNEEAEFLSTAGSLDTRSRILQSTDLLSLSDIEDLLVSLHADTNTTTLFLRDETTTAATTGLSSTSPSTSSLDTIVEFTCEKQQQKKKKLQPINNNNMTTTITNQWDFIASTPVLRSPLMVMNADIEQIDIFPEDYDWSLFMVVTLQWKSSSPESAATDVDYLATVSHLSFLIARLLN